MIRSHYSSQTNPQFRILSQDQIHEIHLAALKVLSRIGVEIPNADALSLLKGAGADVSGSRARIPPHLVQAALESAPSTVTLYTRDGQPALYLEHRNVYFGTYGTAPYTYDPHTGERHLTVKQDMANAARICDCLDWAMPMGVPSDCPIPTADRHQFHAAILNQRKPVIASAYSVAGLADIVEMASVIAGGAEALRLRPFIGTPIDPSSPLRIGETVAGKLLYMAERGLPIILNPMPMCNGTVPSTLAGNLVVTAAEDLCGLVIAQTKRTGTPVVMGGVLTTMDMGTGVCTYGAPELSMMMAAFAELAQYYQIPMYGTAGCSNSKVVDQQAAIESTISILMTALSGANLVHDIGIVDNAMTVSFEALVMCDEIIAMVKRMMGGIEINQDTLAMEVLEKVGPGGHFLSEEHTLRHFKEHHRSKLIDRQNYDAWMETGAATMGERMKAKVQHILAEYQPAPLPEDVQKELERIVRRADEKAAGA
jgi:trimethylamine--corrinoid protein Co-methyltransferase